jgi:putative tricarboxylic transport membrane protein
MDEIQSLLQGFVVALSLKNLALMFVGIVLGVIIGVLPGLGGANGVAILLPLTFSMAQSPGGTTSAIILLSCIYWGALFGGAISSRSRAAPAARSPPRSRRPSSARWSPSS